MAWNHRSRIVAMAVALQAVAGTFVQPSAATDLIAVSSPSNAPEGITADDPTATGTIWEANRVLLGKAATVGATVPLRGPGGASPPAANAWPVGRIMQSGGWAEIRKAASSTAAVVAGSTTNTMVLATTESTVDDFLLGAPLQHTVTGPGTGAAGTTIIRDYVGSTRTALLAETVVAATAGTNYTIPAYLSYVLGTLTTAPPLLSISIWRDKKRYDYRDWAPTSIAVNIPVANEANTSFPDLTFSGRAIVQAVVDDVSPAVPSATLAIPVAPARNGKFYLDRVKLGHQSVSFTETATVGAQSNQNQAAGQDGYDILSGSRATAIDLNQMNVSDFDLHGREDSQVTMPLLSTWGVGPGNYFGFMQPNIQLDPFQPGDRNGYVSLTGNAVTSDVDKSAVLTLWWT